MPSKMIRVEIHDERDERKINLLTPAERRVLLIAGAEKKAEELSGEQRGTDAGTQTT